MFYCEHCKTISTEAIVIGVKYYRQTIRYENNTSEYDYIDDVEYYAGDSNGTECKFCDKESPHHDVEVEEEAFNIIRDKHSGYLQLRKVVIDIDKIDKGEVAFTKNMLLQELI